MSRILGIGVVQSGKEFARCFASMGARFTTWP